VKRFPILVAKLRPPLTTTPPPTAVPIADSDSTAEGTTSPGNPKDEDSVIVTYTLWVGTNVTENFTINVIALRNSSFYHVMQIAAEQDQRYV
jgi:gastric intrinsic factor